MSNHDGFIKAKLKTHRQVVDVHPDALYWGKRGEGGFIGCDNVVLPYLGRTVWLRKRRIDLYDFCFEIRDSRGVIVFPKWIAYFASPRLVPPAEYSKEDGRTDDTWVEPFEERFIYIGDLLVVTG
jgi:hypothetical protein